MYVSDINQIGIVISQVFIDIFTTTAPYPQSNLLWPRVLTFYSQTSVGSTYIHLWEPWGNINSLLKFMSHLSLCIMQYLDLFKIWGLSYLVVIWEGKICSLGFNTSTDLHRLGSLSSSCLRTLSSSGIHRLCMYGLNCQLFNYLTTFTNKISLFYESTITEITSGDAK